MYIALDTEAILHEKLEKIRHNTIISQYWHIPNTTLMGGDIGLLEMRHIVADGVLHIGKEANSVDEQVLDAKRSQVFVNEREVREEILNMLYKESERRRINLGTLWRIKKKVRQNRNITINSSLVKMG
ncbi:hypothetical protein [Methanogenium sp. MK-MG]|uniref:hypothetical protein n=1 Tax=Methanogenium sp. MK-MG TaxID=2599926 RepID=UPI0013EB4BA1|nr:hypothetical protein [Methanogenium sp. MK-MG]KAF1074822.1 hypothetical protein MKMG_01873 [Methanogenium sp. MK-MG]